MKSHHRHSRIAVRRLAAMVLAACCATGPTFAHAQVLTGALVGTVRDAQGSVLSGATVRVTSAALIGGESTVATGDRGQLRFPALPPGVYRLEITAAGFAAYREEGLEIRAGGTIERTAVLALAGVAESVVVEGAGSRIEARDPGFNTRFGPEDLASVPTRRSSMFDFVRAAPGVSPTSPSSGTITTVSAFGSGANENQFLFDGTNVTCPCNGAPRAEPGVEFIHEVQVQSVGASAEYGNVQGAVVNIVTKQGGERFLFGAFYYAQPSSWTSAPVTVNGRGYTRVRYHDFASTLGGPLRRERLWFFGGYQYLRDDDSQPGPDPAFPRTYAQDKVFGKLTWQVTPALQFVPSIHSEFWQNPDRPTLATPFHSTTDGRGSSPAITAHLTHTLSANTLWDARVGRFVFSRDDALQPGVDAANRSDRVTGITSGGPARIGTLSIARWTSKATLTHYRPGLWGGDHQVKIGGQFERGENSAVSVIPGGVRYIDNAGVRSDAVTIPPSNSGGAFFATSAFATDGITVGNRLTMNVGIRFDHTRAFHQDLHAVDALGNETSQVVDGGPLYTWNLVSPRLGATIKITADGRTIMRTSYGRFSPGVLTAELEPFHPGATATTTRGFDVITGEYSLPARVVDPTLDLQLDTASRAPHTDELSIGIDRELTRRLAIAIAYVRKDGADFIGWTEVGGTYREGAFQAADGRSVPTLALTNASSDRRYRLTNPAGYSLTYNGLVLVAEKRRSNGWHAFGSYTLSRAEGLQASSGATAAGAQVSTVTPPQPSLFGRDPNDLTNARGRLPNDRPHMFRLMGSIDVPRTGIAVAANLQQLSGKPWARTERVPLRQGDIRVLLEPRGSQRLSSQTLLDLRLSRALAVGNSGRVELILDLLNLLNDTAEEGIATDVVSAANFAQPTLFIDPRRGMVSVRVNLGR